MKPNGHPLDDCPAYFAWRYLGLNLYKWQVKALMAIGEGVRNGKPPTSLVAANGSGKTQRVIAAAILWFLWRFPRGWCPVTSGSWMQVEKQLFPAIHSFKHLSIFAGWKFNQTEIHTPQGGQCIGFSTDNAGRAEGWHPKVSSDVDPVFYIADEAKSIPDPIFDAIERCTLRYCLFASSPGGPSGKFYRTHHEERNLFHCVKATSADCEHISKDKIARDLEMRGPDDPVYRSMHLAEFTEGSDLLIINPDLVATALQATMGADIPEHNPNECTYFLDFAAGRDENVIAGTDGRNVWIHDVFTEKDTVRAAKLFKLKLTDLGIPSHNVYGDADGLGIGFIYSLLNEGYPVTEWHGGLPAIDDEHYASRISEAWHVQGRCIERGTIRLCGKLARSPTTIRQLTTRLTDWSDKTGKLIAEEKVKMAKRGLKSPDRGDGILCALACHNDHGGAITKRNMAGLVTGRTSQQRFGTTVRRW